VIRCIYEIVDNNINSNFICIRERLILFYKFIKNIKITNNLLTNKTIHLQNNGSYDDIYFRDSKILKNKFITFENGKTLYEIINTSDKYGDINSVLNVKFNIDSMNYKE